MVLLTGNFGLDATYNFYLKPKVNQQRGEMLFFSSPSKKLKSEHFQDFMTA
jgi:hypothetical protein